MKNDEIAPELNAGNMDQSNGSHQQKNAILSSNASKAKLFEPKRIRKKSASTGLSNRRSKADTKSARSRKRKKSNSKYLDKSKEFNNNQRTKLSDTDLIARAKEKLQAHAKQYNIGS